MTSITQEKSEHKLILRQHKKLTFTGFVFSVPGLMLLYSFPKPPDILIVLLCLVFLLFSIHCFYKGVTYTCTTDRNSQTVEMIVKGLFTNKKQTWHFDDIRLLLMGEKDQFLQSPSNCNFEILLDTNDNRRFKLLNFRSRPYCKQTIELMEQYLEEQNG